jgi:hypothetical protein
MLLVLPTGEDSGYGLGARKTRRKVWVGAEHVRLVATAETLP